jgi:hypothetical protein
MSVINAFYNMYEKFHKLDKKESLLKTTHKGIYNNIKNIDAKTTFKYIFIVIILLAYFRNKIIGMNIILALVIGVIVIWYIDDKNLTNIYDEHSERQTKINNIKPAPTKMENKDDMLDFLYSIQDMYEYNPEAYEEMLDNLNAFFETYDTIHRGTRPCDFYYQIAESKKENAVNALHSIVFRVPGDKIIMDKHARAHKRLETLLTNYVNELYDICHYNVLKKGRNVYNRAINLGPKEHNHYFDKDYTYQFY